MADKVHIPLSSAYLCIDCDEVGSDFRNCPACASTALLPLASIMERECSPILTFGFNPMPEVAPCV